MRAPSRLGRPLVATAATLVAWTLVVAAVPSLRDRLPALAPVAAIGVTAAALLRAGRATAAAWVAHVGGGAWILGAIANTGGHGSRLVVFVPLFGLFAAAWGGPGEALVVLAHLTTFSVLLPAGASTDGHVERAVTIAVATVVGAAFAGPLLRDLRRACAEAGTRAQEADEDARRARVDEEASDRFLSSVSHELRTPLDTVLGYTELLLEDERDPVRSGDLGRIRGAAVHLRSLVDDLLDMAVADGEVALEVGRVDLEAIAAEVAGTVAPLVEHSGVRLIVEVPPQVPAPHADPRRVRQILLNLLSNSAKYTEDGTITLRVRADGREVRIDVVDTGLGIPSHRMSEMFRPFVQLHEGTQRRPGVGLGLALSQRLAVRMGGRITVHSIEGAGSTFTLWLPGTDHGIPAAQADAAVSR